MDRAAVPVPHVDETPFRDGLGERRRLADAAGVGRELLRLRAELTQVPAFEFALRERVSSLAEFRHPYFAQVRAVERVVDGEATLGLVSDRLEGAFRLSDLFGRAASRGLNLDINAAVCLLRQVVPAIARFHEVCRDVAHGALGPERVVLTATGRLMVTEYVLGAALEQLHYSQERYWRELRIAVPRSAGLPRFDERTDVTQIGVIALSLILGRTLREDEYPTRVADVVNAAKAIAPKGGFESLPPGLRSWIVRALQLDARHSFATVAEANDELERVLGEIEYPGLPSSVEAFLIRYHEADFAAAMAPSGAVAHTPLPLDEFRPEWELPKSPKSAEVPPPLSALSEFDAEPTPTAPRSASPPMDRSSTAAERPLPLASSATSPVISPVTSTVASSNASSVTSPPALPLGRAPSPSIAASDVERPAPAARDLFATEETPGGGRWKIAAALALVLGAGAAYAPLSRQLRTPPPATPAGTLVVRTTHPGTTVLLDGKPLGTTPVTAAVVAGPHTLELLSAGITKTVPLTITGGARVEQYIEMPLAPSTEDPAAVSAATAPGTPADVNGPTIGGAGRQTVVESTVRSPEAAPPPAEGWLTMQTPIELTVDAGGRTIGSSANGRLLLPAGSHEVTLRNDTLGFRLSRKIAVAAGKATPVVVEVPNGVVAVNALPWAEVWVDGQRIGETPIGNLSLAIGNHDVLLRHPDHGEQHHTVTVTTSGVARVSVDLRR